MVFGNLDLFNFGVSVFVSLFVIVLLVDIIYYFILMWLYGILLVLYLFNFGKLFGYFIVVYKSKSKKF